MRECRRRNANRRPRGSVHLRGPVPACPGAPSGMPPPSLPATSRPPYALARELCGEAGRVDRVRRGRAGRAATPRRARAGGGSRPGARPHWPKPEMRGAGAAPLQWMPCRACRLSPAAGCFSRLPPAPHRVDFLGRIASARRPRHSATAVRWAANDIVAAAPPRLLPAQEPDEIGPADSFCCGTARA